MTHVSPVVYEVVRRRDARRSTSYHWIIDQHAIHIEVGRVICIEHVAANERAIRSGIAREQSGHANPCSCRPFEGSHMDRGTT